MAFRIGFGALLLALTLLPASSEARDAAYEAFLACNEQLANADAVPDCAADAETPYAGGAFHIPSPRLYRASEDSGGHLLHIIQGKCPYCAPNTVIMRRDWLGRWRAVHWERRVFVEEVPVQIPAMASVSIDGAVEWASEDLVFDDIVLRNGTCRVKFSHVFFEFLVQAPVACEPLTQPGTHPASEIVPDDEEILVTYIGLIGKPGFGTRTGTFEILDAPDGFTSGRLLMDVDHLGRNYRIAISFENVPLGEP